MSSPDAFALKKWRRRSLRISIDPDKQIVEAIVEAGEPMVLFVGGEPN
jgi:hypothetical protein